VFFRNSTDEKRSYRTDDLRDDLTKLIAKARDARISSWDIERILESNAEQLSFHRTMRTVA
jgi:hypothetical protein